MVILVTVGYTFLAMTLILIYTTDQKRLYQVMRPIPGSALFFARDMRWVPPYLATTMFTNHIIYEDNIIVSITQLEEPYGSSAHFRECYVGGMRHFDIMLGYMEVVDMGMMLREAGIRYRAIFYGLEEISTTNPIWRIFSLIKRLPQATSISTSYRRTACTASLPGWRCRGHSAAAAATEKQPRTMQSSDPNEVFAPRLRIVRFAIPGNQRADLPRVGRLASPP